MEAARRDRQPCARWCADSRRDRPDAASARPRSRPMKLRDVDTGEEYELVAWSPIPVDGTFAGTLRKLPAADEVTALVDEWVMSYDKRLSAAAYDVLRSRIRALLAR